MGHSKEKRTDAPLVTLALVLDASGFIQRSRLFPGNISEPKTLEEMLLSLQAPKNALVVMDRGIATEKNRDYMDVMPLGGTGRISPGLPNRATATWS